MFFTKRLFLWVIVVNAKQCSVNVPCGLRMAKNDFSRFLRKSHFRFHHFYALFFHDCNVLSSSFCSLIRSSKLILKKSLYKLVYTISKNCIFHLSGKRFFKISVAYIKLYLGTITNRCLSKGFI